MAGHEAHHEEEEVEEEEEEEEGDEEDDSCYSYDDGDDEESVGDEGGQESDDISSSNGDEAGEHEQHALTGMAKQSPRAEPRPDKHTAKREGASAWPPSAPPPGFTLLPRGPAPSASARHFVSASVPCSRSSSPRSPSGADLVAALHKWGRPSRRSRSNLNPLSRRRSPAPSYPSTRRERDAPLRRSKSCGEGRASQPPDELDIWPKLAVSNQHEPEDAVADSDSEKGPKKEKPHAQGDDDGFKCGAFCMFLPGFSKGKQVQVQAHRDAAAGSHGAARLSVASRAASLEKFECGSWSSSVILNGAEEEEGIPQSYFDLPLELLRGSGNDTESPVKAAFLFDRDRRGVLKGGGPKGAGGAAPRRLHESPGRHVTFSAAGGTQPSSPTAFCISPRLRRARDEFNAFLEAQNA